MSTVFWGAAGTATVKLTIPREKDEITTKTLEGCLLKKDANLGSFIEENLKDQSADRKKLERSKYLFYAPDSDFKGNVTEATLTYPEISKKRGETRQKMKECTVEDPLIIRVYGHLFLCCDSQLNQSKFLDEYCKEVRTNQSLDCSKKFCGLGSERNGQFVFTSFGMSQCQSSNGLYKIKDEWVYEKLKDAGPLLLDDNKTAVGCFRKTNDCRILVLIFDRNQVLGGSVQPLPSGSRVDGSPPGGLPSGQTPTSPSGDSSSDQPPTPPPGDSSSDQPPTPPQGGSSTNPNNQSGSTSVGGSYAADGVSSPTQQQEGASSTEMSGSSFRERNQINDTGNQGDDTGNHGDDTGNQGDDTGNQGNQDHHQPNNDARSYQGPDTGRNNISSTRGRNEHVREHDEIPNSSQNQPAVNLKNKLEFKKYRRLLIHIAINLSRDWRTVGYKLGLSDNDLELVENNDRAWDIREKAYQMLLKWINKPDINPTLPDLRTALEDSERKGLSELEHLSVEVFSGDAVNDAHETRITVTDDLLNEVAKHLSKDWKFVGRFLELDEHVLDNIDINYPKSVTSRASKMLIAWKNNCKDGEATTWVLKEALRRVERGDVIQIIEDWIKRNGRLETS